MYLYSFGGPGEIRTHTYLRTVDFKSTADANFATGPSSLVVSATAINLRC